jgi:hypothetical protein
VGVRPNFTEITVTAAMVGTASVCVFMASLGLWMSLASPTATRAMSLTVLGWIIAQTVINVAASVLGVLLALLSDYVLSILLSGYGSFLSPAGFGFTPMHEIITMIIHATCFLLVAFVISLYCRRRFDLLAGRTFAPAIPSARRPRRVAQPRPLPKPPKPDTVVLQDARGPGQSQ